ncbi:CLUMA_CG010801, isoform A [Clunio marinus]|uniref:CLUMA_CG010801, isoform A n=1 Tax=Clunio marinus TaxID=568069 RepID=A0A1J1ICY0_9DIPT|nr:CLUMA_CG010801, isoform A [Clunio marinus]
MESFGGLRFILKGAGKRVEMKWIGGNDGGRKNKWTHHQVLSVVPSSHAISSQGKFQKLGMLFA